MKCEIAKNNPVLMDLAIEHYTAGNKTTFTFMSLYDDFEPYPKQELIHCLNARIEKLEALFIALPTVGIELSLKKLQKAHKILSKGKK